MKKAILIKRDDGIFLLNVLLCKRATSKQIFRKENIFSTGRKLNILQFARRMVLRTLTSITKWYQFQHVMPECFSLPPRCYLNFFIHKFRFLGISNLHHMNQQAVICL